MTSTTSRHVPLGRTGPQPHLNAEASLWAAASGSKGTLRWAFLVVSEPPLPLSGDNACQFELSKKVRMAGEADIGPCRPLEGLWILLSMKWKHLKGFE